MRQIFCFLDNFYDNILPKNLLILPYNYQIHILKNIFIKTNNHLEINKLNIMS